MPKPLTYYISNKVSSRNNTVNHDVKIPLKYNAIGIEVTNPNTESVLAGALSIESNSLDLIRQKHVIIANNEKIKHSV